MKLIHCADLHLDSKMTANLDKEKAKTRKAELLKTFGRMVAYASDNGVSGILICGDLFDTKVISATTRNAVISEIINHPEIDFYYLKGNHDNDNFLSSMDEIPGNLKLFGDSWTEYTPGESGRVKLFGVELSHENSMACQTAFVPNPENINIVMLHGQESEALAKDKAEVIDLKLFRNKGINYLALGHIHQYKSEALDGAGKYCYCGCLEGRGFDECGEHGFVLLDIDEENGRVQDTFIPFAGRKLYTFEIDISGLESSSEIIAKARGFLDASQAQNCDLVKIILKGSVSVECEKDTEYITTVLKDDFYFLKVYDETTIFVDYASFAMDESLKGEFVRLVEASDMPDEYKAEVIKTGLYVIAGGKIDED